MSFPRSGACLVPALVALGVSLASLPSPARAGTTYTFVTNFTKSNNIYTNLNEQYPNTGIGVPGSKVGVPNASLLFNPATYTSANYIAGSNLANNGVNFQLTSNAAGMDFEEVDGGTTLTLSPNVAGANAVYLLLAAYDGQSCTVTFTGSGGATETFTGFPIPDFNGGGPINSTGTDSHNQNSYLVQTVLQVQDVGAGGTGNSTTGAFNNYDLTEGTFNLAPAFFNQTLTSIQITSNGYETLLLGATIGSTTASAGAAPEPGVLALLAIGVAPVGLLARRRLHGGQRTAR